MKKANLCLLFVSIILVVFCFWGCQGKQETEGEEFNIDEYDTPESETAPVFDDLINQYNEFLKEEPENLSALIGLGNAYFDSKDNENAVEIYTKALKLDPNNVNVRVDRGVSYRRLHNYDLAIEDFKKGISLNPNHSIALYNLGVVYYFDKQDYKSAIESWEKFLKLEPEGQRAENARQKLEEAKQLLAKTGE